MYAQSHYRNDCTYLHTLETMGTKTTIMAFQVHVCVGPFVSSTLSLTHMFLTYTT